MSNTQSKWQVGDTCTVTIDNIAFGGAGVGRVNGMAIFVPYVITGEQVRVTITDVKPRYLRGEISACIASAPSRVEPACPWYGRCAGCQYQHMPYAMQLAEKRNQVVELFKRIAGLDVPPVSPAVPAPAPYGYRSRITLHGPGKPAYIGVDGRTRVAVAHCPIAHTAVNQTLEEWNQAHPDGLKGGQRLTLTLAADGNVWISEGASDRLVRQHVLGTDFDVPLKSFFQVNPAVAERLVADVLAEIKQSGAPIWMDAYAGVGVFGLLAAPHVDRVYALESDAAAVQAAKRNARRLGISTYQARAIRVEQGLKGWLAQVDGGDCGCILDPPRRGCDAAVLDLLIRHPVRRVLYIACAPDKLARDTRRLLAGGYRLERVAPYDMFPQTAHIEALAVFVRS